MGYDEKSERRNHRHDDDDPVLLLREDPQRVASWGQPTPPRQVAPQAVTGSADAPTIVATNPGNYPVGGGPVTVPVTTAFIGATPQLLTNLVNILQWSSNDGSSRRGVVTLTTTPVAIGGVAQDNAAVACRITMGSPRGAVTFWEMAPAIVPVQGTYVRVDAGISFAPLRILSSIGGPQAVTRAGMSAQVAANWYDAADASFWPQPALLNNSNILIGPAVCDSVHAPQFKGPVILTSLLLSNNNPTAGVWIAIGDSITAMPPGGQWKSVVMVNPMQTLSVGRALLGSFGCGVGLVGYTDPKGAAAEDPNDVNVVAQMYGIWPQFGT